MSRLTIGQKAHRVLQFLIGLQAPGVVGVLSEYGFTEDDLKLGVDLLNAVTHERLKPSPPSQQPGLIAALEAFQKRWFQVARLTLEHNYPAVAVVMFANLPGTEGREVAVAVTAFIARLQAMEEGAAAMGPDGSAARALLVRRGLTPERVAEATALLERLSKLSERIEPSVDPEERRAVEDALWRWYLEWGGIARSAIHEKRLLRALGFRRNARHDAELIEDEQPDNAPLALPAAAPVVATDTDNQRPTLNGFAAAGT